MFDNLMTRCTIAYQIRQSVCFYIFFNSKYSERDFMMNVKLLADFFFSDRASLAFIIVSVSCIAALLLPVFSIIWFITTFPTSAIFTRFSARFTHPIISAFLRAKSFFSNLGRAPVKFLIAEQAYNFNAIILRVICSAFGGFLLINYKTSLCAKCFSKSINSIWFALYRDSAYFAIDLYKLSACCISTLKRTIFLFRMRTWRLEFYFAFKAWFGGYCSTRLVSAIDRTKTNNSVGSLFNLRLTMFTGFHRANLIII